MSELIKPCQMEGSWALLELLMNRSKEIQPILVCLKQHSIFSHPRMPFCAAKVQLSVKRPLCNAHIECKNLDLVFIEM